MHVCSGCGFKNRPDREACSKCGQVFREAKDFSPLLKKIGGGVVAVLVVGIALLRIFGPTKMEAKMKRFEEREARKNRTEEPALPKREVPRAPEAERKVEPVPPPRPPEPEELTPRERGQELLRSADRRFAQGDYPGAAEEYQKAERLGASSPESKERKQACADIAYIVMYRDYMDREKILEPARLVGARSNLALIKPFTLPNDTWRELHRTTLARVDKAYKQLVGEDTKPGSYEAQPVPRLPRLVSDETWKNMKFLLKPVAPDGGRIAGASFLEVAPDGLVGMAGIRNGDVLIEINDRAVTHINQTINLRTAIEQDRGFWGVVRRGDERVPFRVEFPGGK